MSILPVQVTRTWWQQLRPRLTLIYILVVLILVGLSVVGQIRLLNEVGKTFGGFFWAIDNTDGQVVVVSTPPQLSSVPISADSLTSSNRIIAVNGQKGPDGLSYVYSHVKPGTSLTYTVQHNQQTMQIVHSTYTFTLDMWFGNYGLAFLAGLSWLLVGGILLATAGDWSGAVEGLTLLPPAMLFLLYSHWGNVQQAYPADAVFQLLWVPAFALLGAAFIHLSLTYRPEALQTERVPRLAIDGLPYLPLLALLAYEWSSYLIFGQVPTRINLTVSLGYGVLGGVISLCIGLTSLARVWRIVPQQQGETRTLQVMIPSHIRRRIGDLLTLWIGGVGLGFCLGILPILLTGQTLLPLSMFYILAIAHRSACTCRGDSG